MARSLIYPGADQARRYDRAYPGLTQPAVSKVVLHSTETSSAWGCPGYGGGAAAPTLTACPWTRRIWQHFPVTMSARALLNPASTPVSENRDNVAQIEIIGYSDAGYGQKYGSNLRDLSDDQYRWLARIVRWFHDEWDVPLRIPSRPWLPYPSSYGNSAARMTSSEYDRFTGVLAHMHVSGNLHGDVTLDAGRLIRLAGGAFAPQTSEFTPLGRLTTRQVQELLGVTVDGQYGPSTTRAVLAIQEALDLTPDGLWGPTTEGEVMTLIEDIQKNSRDLKEIKTLARNIERSIAGAPHQLLERRVTLSDWAKNAMGTELDTLSVSGLLTYAAAGGFGVTTRLVAALATQEQLDTGELAKALADELGEDVRAAVAGLTGADPDAIAKAVADEVGKRLAGAES